MLHICAVRTNAHAHHTLCLHALCPAHAKHVLRACQLQQFSWLQWHQWADRDGMKRPLPRTKILMVVIWDCDSLFAFIAFYPPGSFWSGIDGNNWKRSLGIFHWPSKILSKVTTAGIRHDFPSDLTQLDWESNYETDLMFTGSPMWVEQCRSF